MNALNIILSPLISEKSMNEVGRGRYTFKVGVSANKNSIRKAIEDKFKVNVVKISTITTKGRSVKGGTRRSEILKQPFKKAIVTLKAGQKIGIFEQGAKAQWTN